MRKSSVLERNVTDRRQGPGQSESFFSGIEASGSVPGINRFTHGKPGR